MYRMGPHTPEVAVEGTHMLVVAVAALGTEIHTAVAEESHTLVVVVVVPAGQWVAGMIVDTDTADIVEVAVSLVVDMAYTAWPRGPFEGMLIVS